MSDERLSLLEQRMDTTIQRVDSKLDNIAAALQTLVRIEERQLHVSKRFDEFSAGATSREERLRQVELAMPENLDKRLSSIETTLPGLKELRKWVISGVLGGLGMMGAAILHTVLKG